MQYIICSTIYAVHYMQYIISSTSYAVHYMQYIICSTLYAVHYITVFIEQSKIITWSEQSSSYSETL